MRMRPSISGSDDIHREIGGAEAARRGRPLLARRRRRARPAAPARRQRRARRRPSSSRAEKAVALRITSKRFAGEQPRAAAPARFGSLRLVDDRRSSTARPRAASASASASIGAVIVGEVDRAVEDDQRARRLARASRQARVDRGRRARSARGGGAGADARRARLRDEMRGRPRMIVGAALLEIAPDAARAPRPSSVEAASSRASSRRRRAASASATPLRARQRASSSTP